MSEHEQRHKHKYRYHGIQNSSVWARCVCGSMIDGLEIISRVNEYPKLKAENERLRREIELDNVQFGQVEADDICN